MCSSNYAYLKFHNKIQIFSFSEFFSAYNGERKSAWKDYITYGGLPRILSCKSDEQKSKYLMDLFKNVYIKDIIERNRLKGDVIMENLVEVLASSVGSLTNPVKLANTFVSNGIKANDKTISSYIGYLEDSFLIEKAERYDIKVKKYKLLINYCKNVTININNKGIKYENNFRFGSWRL